VDGVTLQVDVYKERENIGTEALSKQEFVKTFKLTGNMTNLQIHEDASKVTKLF
jgi:hypothetical protein